jgi:hypothetical protein
MEQVARGDRHSETLRALGKRMIRLDRKLYVDACVPTFSHAY